MKKTIIAIALASISLPAFADFTLTADENRNSPLSILPYSKAVAVSTSPGKTLVIEKRGLDDSGLQVIQETSYDQPLQDVLQSDSIAYAIHYDDHQWSIETKGHSERVNAYTKAPIDSTHEAWARGMLAFNPVDKPFFELPLIQSGFVFANQVALGQTGYEVSPEAQKLIQALNRPKHKHKNNQNAWDKLNSGVRNNEARDVFFAH